MRIKRKLLSLMLSLVMVLSLLPMTAFAAAPSQPTNVQVDESNQKVTWEAVSEATEYLVGLYQVDAAASNGRITMGYIRVPTAYAEWSNFDDTLWLGGKEYFVSVQACNASDERSTPVYSESFTCNKEVLEIKNIHWGTTESDCCVLYWDEVPTATKYTVSIKGPSGSGSGGGTVTTNQYDARSFVISKGNGDYTATVYAYRGQTGSTLIDKKTATTHSITIPTLATPVVAVDLSSYEITWDTIEHASSYTVELHAYFETNGYDNGYNWFKGEKYGITGTSCSLSEFSSYLENGKNYFVRVSAKDSTGSYATSMGRSDYFTYSHTHTYTAVVTEPTCTEKGYTTHTCACGDSYVDTYITATGHTYGEWAITKEPTLTEKGMKECFCTACGDKQTEELPVLTPTTYSIISGANGKWTKGSTDGLIFVSDAPIDKFSIVKVDAENLGDTFFAVESGSTKVTLSPEYLETLSNGSHSIEIVSTDGSASSSFTVEAPVAKTPITSIDVKWEAPTIGQRAGDVAFSYITEPANACVPVGEVIWVDMGNTLADSKTLSENDVFEAGHKYKAYRFIAPADGFVFPAGSSGYYNGSWLNNGEETTGTPFVKEDGTMYISTNYIYPVCLHENTEVSDAVPAGCAAEGYTGDTYCVDCGELLEEGSVIEKTPHTEVTIPGKAATCTETGLTDGKKCAICGEVLVAQKTVAMTAHTYGEWTITKEPTETETGSKERTCSACGDKQTEELPVLTPATYSIIFGANGEWTKGSTTGLAFTSDAPFDKFDSVKIDGTVIAAVNYTAEAGSTKITLAPAYLETLSVGTHTIEIVSNDGSASTNFTVKSAEQPPVVPTNYTVTFNMNGHGDQITAQTVKEGEKATKPTDPTASGWTFNGWYADATFSAAFDFDTAIAADTTIYAKWTENSVTPPTPANYTVTFNMNGHGTQVAAQTVKEGEMATKPADPSASGYTFDGWYADATFSAKFDFSSAINANTTVYAKWTEVKKDEPTKPADPTNPIQPVKPADPTSPQTGDNSHLFLWVALLFISGGALAGTAVYGKKRKYNAK